MSIDSYKNKDIEEIFLHVKKIKKEKLDNSKKILDNNEEITFDIKKHNVSTEDISERLNEDETVTKMNLKNPKICDFCGQDIILDENLSGLVLQNKFFACEECCNNASNEVINRWIETRNAKTEDVKPIALWLMQVKNKTRLI